MDNIIVDIRIIVIQKTGMFTHGYTKWLELDDVQKNVTHFKQFWHKQCSLLKKTT